MSGLHDVLTDLGEDVDRLVIEPPAAIRARGRARARRRLTVTACLLAVGAVGAVPALRYGSTDHSGATAADVGVGRGDIALFLTDGCTVEERAVIEAELARSAAVTRYHFESHHEAYQRFEDIYANHPDIVASVDPRSMPESYRITLRSPDDRATLMKLIAKLPCLDTTIG